jgi:DNA-binding beta-propeller fold protein YncE
VVSTRLQDREVDVNKILAILCGIGLLAVAAVVGYIWTQEPRPVEPPPATNTDSPKDIEPKIETNAKKRVVADAFFNPCGVAVQPETGHVFVSMVGRIVRVVPGEPAAVHDEITGFPTDTYGRGPVYQFGPLGLAFADKTTLIVGDGSLEDGKEIVRIYKVGSQPLAKDKVRQADDMSSYSTPIPPGEDSVGGEGNYYGVAVKGATVFVTSNGDDTKGWICKLELNLKTSPPLTLVPFIKSKELTDTNAPTGATISPDGKLVVCQFGAVNAHPDSLLTFYDPATGKLDKKFTTGLRDLCGAAYSPKTGALYGVDFSWADHGKGGLFRLDISGDQLKAVKVADLVRPTALAFSPDGKLYVTVVGTDKEKEKKTGQLLVFEGL